jgi:hypothetical protein
LDFLELSGSDEEDLKLDYEINLEGDKNKKPKFKRIFDAKYKFPSVKKVNN